MHPAAANGRGVRAPPVPGQLGDADAEDAVSEVLLRLHRQVESGRPPRNLQAAFFTGVRNASIDILRARSARPTVGLEAVQDAVGVDFSPFERAESAEDSVRLQEALGRMRGNYREAVVLRFGLGLTVPEIAEKMGISLPAAKKLVLRATAQARARLEAIDEHEFCAEMRDTAERAVFDREAVGVLGSEETKVLHAHFRHCGPCRSFLARLHEDLHELGSGLVVVSAVGARVGVVGRVRGWLESVGDGLGLAHDKARLTAYRLSGGFSSGDGTGAGMLAGSSQKLAAVCTVGAAGAAGCLASGLVGPGVGLGIGNAVQSPHRSPAPKVRPAPHHAARQVVAAPLVEPTEVPAPESSSAAASASTTTPKASAAARSDGQEAKPKAKESAEKGGKAEAKTAAAQVEQEFGFESESEGSSAPAPVEAPAPREATSSSTSSSSSSSPPAPSPAPAPAPSPSSSGGGSSSSSSGGSDFGSFEK